MSTSWISSTACSAPSTPDNAATFEILQEWIAYILFAQCPQHLLASAIHFLFLVAVSISKVQQKLSRVSGVDASLRNHTKATYKCSIFVTLSLSFFVSIISAALLVFYVWAFLQSRDSSYVVGRELAFICLETIGWICSCAILRLEKNNCATKHGYLLRIWWWLMGISSLFELMSSIFRLVRASGFGYGLILEACDVYAVIKFPLSAYLFYKSIYATTGIPDQNDGVSTHNGIHSPLLGNEGANRSPQTSLFASASFFSKLTIGWLTPVLVAGSKRSLDVEDIPELANPDQAENIFDLFKKNWPQEGSCSHPMTLTIWRSFWPQIMYIGLLHLVRSVAMFIGPLLIPSFTSYVQGVYITSYDGYVLVLLLFLSKSAEVVSYHQSNFLAYKLGNNIRMGIATMLFHKALHLSNSSRQAHGVGQITNYMIVDAQQISDACLQLHTLWAVPLQIAAAVMILYFVLGLASMAGLAVLIAVAISTIYISGRQKLYQARLMNYRDTRMKAIIEMLAYIKVIKLQAWEEKFKQRIEEYRLQEYSWLRKFVFATAQNMGIFWNTQPLVSTATYMVAVLINTPLSTSVIFTAASIFRIIQAPSRMFPQAVAGITQMLISLQRLDKFMLTPELQQNTISRKLILDDFPIVMEDGSFSWDEAAGEPILTNINLEIKKGSLVTVVGTVGSGKSSLLCALLGEMVKLSGKAKSSGSIGYVAQNAWIQNATIEENILFGGTKCPLRYDQVLRACALIEDLSSMDFGDQTEIGEKGINLSGGQKQRIQLARAIYQDKDVYLLDDVLSAVDAHTGSHLFKECICGILSGKTVLLVTHQVEFLAQSDLILVMKDGKISQAGRYEEILVRGSDFEALVAAHNQAMQLVKSDEGRTGALLERKGKEMFEHGTIGGVESLEVRLSGSADMSMEVLSDTKYIGDGVSKLIESEKRETGRVSARAYRIYLTKAYGWSVLIVLLISQVIWQILLVLSNFWIADEIPADASDSYDSTKFIVVYAILNVASCFIIMIRIFLVPVIGLKTSQLFFFQMLESIIRAPMSFFDTTPSGRVLSRFSSDQTNIDFILHFYMGILLGTILTGIGIVVPICISAWPTIILVIPLGILYYSYQVFFIHSSREITRLDSITKAPAIYHFSETIAGIETIRCFWKEKAFMQKNFNNLNSNMKMDFNNNSANEWLGLRLEEMGVFVLGVTGLVFVILPSNLIKTDYVGLALSYALGLNVSLFWNVWMYCTVENKMVSVERIEQFTNIDKEADYIIKDCVPSNWPSVGKIISKRLKLRYRPSTPLVLKGVTFTIAGGHKVGIVGRTGSGKSSLILAIFRLVEPAGGEIIIDDIDITSMGLHDLRSRLGIIPQEPVLFQGTLRLNLDPFDAYSDAEIWEVLEKCQLDKIVREKPERLSTPVMDYGENWSLGQRQLLCFGRTLLKKSKILFLDEATASVDAQTDRVIQELIREQFQNCTVVSIAHRIPTVMDSDEVLVMDAGRVKEFDSPSALLAKTDSLFSSLVNEYKARADHLQ